MPVFAEASFIGQYFPGFFLGNRHRNHRHHPGPRDAVLDNPEQFAVASSVVEFAIGEIPGTGLQTPADRTISHSGFPMARHTGTFSFIQNSSLVHDLGGSRFRRTEGRDQFPGPYSFTRGHSGTQGLHFFSQNLGRTGPPTHQPQAHDQQDSSRKS